MLNDYSFIKAINDTHQVYLVKNNFDNKHYVQKVLQVYDYDVLNALSKVNINGIPHIKEIIKEDDKLIVFEEYISGKTLQELIDANYKFSNKEIIDIAIRLCDIMLTLNSNFPIVHRDIKPSNIIRGYDNYYLIDFNAAKFIKDENKDTILLGTQGYAAPEQYGFSSSNIKTDIYAIGILIKELGGNNLNKQLKHISDICTNMDSNNRYPSFKSLKQALKVCLKTKCYYAPVGFRMLNIWHILIAIYFYSIGIYMSLTVTYSDGSSSLPTKIQFLMLTFLIPAFSFNYLGIQDKIGLYKYKPIVKVILIILCDIVILSSFFIIGVALFNITIS